MYKKILLLVTILAIGCGGFFYGRYYIANKDVIRGEIVKVEDAEPRTICFDGCAYPLLISIRTKDDGVIVLKGVTNQTIAWATFGLEVNQDVLVEIKTQEELMGSKVRVKGNFNQEKNEVSLSEKDHYLKLDN